MRMGINTWTFIFAFIWGGLIAVPSAGRAEDWPHWRGPRRDGTSTERGWTDQWPKDGPKIAWKASVGLGFSAVSVADGRLVTMGHVNGRDLISCWDAVTGKPLWQHSYDSELGDKFFEGGPTSTPTVSAGRVYALSRWGDVFCFDLASGRIRWSKNVQKETGAAIPDWGFSSSPLIYQSKLILNIGEAGLALDPENGTILWQSAPAESGYSTPLPFRQGNASVVLVSSGKAYAAVQLADGKPLWRFEWVTRYGVNASDPIVDTAGESILISSGYGKGAALLNLRGGSPAVVWQHRDLRTQMNPGVLLQGFVYGTDGDNGAKAPLKCIELKTGQVRWTEPGIGTGGVTLADGKLIVLSDRGELLVAPASPEQFKTTARAQVLGGRCWTVPVLAHGRVYCRNAAGDLICVDLRTAGR
jgi:outer membrane protein assembly factor BamB